MFIWWNMTTYKIGWNSVQDKTFTLINSNSCNLHKSNRCQTARKLREKCIHNQVFLNWILAHKNRILIKFIQGSRVKVGRLKICFASISHTVLYISNLTRIFINAYMVDCIAWDKKLRKFSQEY